MDSKDYVIHETDELSKFHANRFNRRIKRSKVENLKDSMRKMGYIPNIPIVVTPDYFVINGNHRLTAVKELREDGHDITIFYTISRVLNLRDVGTWDDWDTEDVIYTYANQGYEEYKTLIDFLDKYRGIRLSDAVSLCYDGSVSFRKEIREAVKEGTYKCNGLLIAEQVARTAILFKNISSMKKHWHQRQFVAAIWHVVRTKGFDCGRFKKQVGDYGEQTVFPRVSSRDYLDLLTEMYNFRLKGERTRFSLPL